MKNISNKFNYLFEHMNQGVIFLNLEAKVISANQASMDMFGLSLKEMQNISLIEKEWHIINEDGSPCEIDEYPGFVALRTKENQLGKIIGVYKTKTKSYTWLMFDVIVENDDNNNMIGVFQIFTDITELKNLKEQSERKAKISENRLELLFKNIPLLIAHVDKDYIYKYVNNSYLEYLPNKNFDDIVGKSVKEILSKDELENVEPLMKIALSGSKISYSRKSMNVDREDMYLEGTLFPYTNGEGELDGFVLISQDITEKIKLLNKTRQQEAELIQQSKMAMVGEMIGAVAHQWKQPLSILSLYAQDIPDRVDDNELSLDDAKEITSEMMKQIHYMSDTITDFRNFFKPSKTVEVFSIHNAIIDTQRLIENQLLTHNINIVIEGKDYFTKGYFNDFKQVLLNIVNNAKDAFLQRKQDNGVIKFLITLDKNKIHVKIEDNGGGISSNLLPDKIFDAYVSTKGDKGTGIGLSLVKKIIDKMDGDIKAYNSKEGAVFDIELKTYKETRC